MLYLTDDTIKDLQPTGFNFVDDPSNTGLLTIKLDDFFDCPICLCTITDPPVFKCENDHLLCHTCHAQVRAAKNQCPVSTTSYLRSISFLLDDQKLLKKLCQGFFALLKSALEILLLSFFLLHCIVYYYFGVY